jgi:hypothetical protein
MEGLGSTSMRILCLVGLLKLLLDGRLSHHGLDHLERCPLCDQEEETVQHLLTSCVFARSVWFSVLCIVGLQHLAPGLENCKFIGGVML